MSADTFDKQIEAARRRLEALQRSAKDSGDQKGLLRETLEELSTALEELHVAAEGLRQQNEELAFSRQAIEVERQRYQDLFEFAPDCYLVTDPDGIIREANRAAATLLGLRPGFSVGKPLLVFVAKQAQEAFHLHLSRIQDEGNTGGDWELSLQPRAGMSFPAALTVGLVHDTGGRLTGLRWLIRDISKRKEAEELLRSISTKDELTGLHNRRGFLTLAPQYLKMADRTKKAALLLFADLDGLKSINDTLGHPAGDRALTTVAHILNETFRQSDILARMGGDEFAVLAMETPITGAEKVTARLQGNLDSHNRKSSSHLSLSLGVARYDREHRGSVEELLAQADAEMYQQKRSKRDSFIPGEE
jgi:diguanylate cyclase (GGDEF)-like protein/PAS domain S-box-containing protein